MNNIEDNNKLFANNLYETYCIGNQRYINKSMIINDIVDILDDIINNINNSNGYTNNMTDNITITTYQIQKCLFIIDDRFIDCENQKLGIKFNELNYCIESDIDEYIYNYIDNKIKTIINLYFIEDISNIIVKYYHV